MPKPLLNVKVLNGSMRNDHGYNEKEALNTHSVKNNNYVENTYFLSNTQKVSKVVTSQNPNSYPNNNINQSLANDDAKAFLNSTLNVSNYNSNPGNPNDTRNF